MDPQKLSSLDPKLRDAYQRVMGTAIPQPQVKPNPIQAAPVQTPQSAPEPQPAIAPDPQPAPANFSQMNSEMPSQTVPNQNFQTPAQVQPVVIKRKNNLFAPVLFVIIGLVFIAIYTLFWTRIFNFKLPFLP